MIFFTLLLIFNSVFLWSQTRTVVGYITDNENNGLADVLIHYQNKFFVGQTDTTGMFSILVPDTAKAIVFSKNGYKTKTIKLDKTNKITAQLELINLFELSIEEIMQLTVSTVTLKKQTINNVPGIVSVITQDDLRALGMRNIREMLSLFAGFAPLQNDDEQILAFRGIFGTTNQKILVLRDGSPINEPNLDIPQMDYSISIDNIKKIEIIRGPGASIYGNSALAAVVNIITTDGNISRAKISVGNYGQTDIEAHSAVKLNDSAMISVYGRYYTNDGENKNVKTKTGTQTTDAKYFTGHYANNVDMGFKYKRGIISSVASARRHCYQTYWTTSGEFVNTDSTIIEPKLIQHSAYFDFLVNPKIKDNISLHLQHYANYVQLADFRVTANISEANPKGGYQNFEWNAMKTGFNYYGIWDNDDNLNILVGAAYENRYYLHSHNITNSLQEPNSFSIVDFYPKGNEYRWALFTQAQYTIFEKINLNLGGRYDFAQDFEAQFNPRIAAIVQPMKQLSFKLIYSEAFQAPGYSYRESNAPFVGANVKLEAEHLTTWQTSVRYELVRASYIEITAYKNFLKNMITRYTNPYYENTGKFASQGVELTSRVNLANIVLFGNYSLMMPIKSEMDEIYVDKNVRETDFRHFPKHTINTGLIIRINKFSVSTYGQYASQFYGRKNSEGNDIKIPSRLIINASAKYNIKDFELMFSAKNITNKEYSLGDASVLPIPQQGLWFLFSVAYTVPIKQITNTRDE